MRKIILMMSVALDGYFERLDRDISWHLVDDELLRSLNEQFRAMGAPEATSSPGCWGSRVLFRRRRPPLGRGRAGAAW